MNMNFTEIKQNSHCTGMIAPQLFREDEVFCLFLIFSNSIFSRVLRDSISHFVGSSVGPLVGLLVRYKVVLKAFFLRF